MTRTLTRYAWAMAFVLGAAALLFWPIRWVPVAIGLAVATWLFRKKLGIVAPLLLLVILSGLVFASNFVVYEEEVGPSEPALTPNPVAASEFDLSVISWLLFYDPYLHGIVLPILLVLVPLLLLGAFVYVWRTSPGPSPR